MLKLKFFVPFLILVGCKAITLVMLPDHLVAAPNTFSHEVLHRVLHQFVDEQGRVDYAALKDDTDSLERYYYLLTLYSPDSHPDLFPTRQSKLTYWINAYNAGVIKTVLAHYPISSVIDIERPLTFFFLPVKAEHCNRPQARSRPGQKSRCSWWRHERWCDESFRPPGARQKRPIRMRYAAP